VKNLAENALLAIDARVLSLAEYEVLPDLSIQPLDTIDQDDNGVLRVSVKPLSVVNLSSDVVSRAPNGQLIFALWGAADIGPRYWHATEGDSVSGLIPQAPTVVQAFTDTLASPLAVVAPTGKEGVLSCRVELQPSSPFVVRLVDQVGRPLRSQFIRIGSGATSALDQPCVVRGVIKNGELRVDHLIAGEYIVEFIGPEGGQCRQSMTLSPEVRAVEVVCFPVLHQ
jgi:hypothetical protein